MTKRLPVFFAYSAANFALRCLEILQWLLLQFPCVGVYESGKVKATPAMQEAYEIGKRV